MERLGCLGGSRDRPGQEKDQEGNCQKGNCQKGKEGRASPDAGPGSGERLRNMTALVHSTLQGDEWALAMDPRQESFSTRRTASVRVPTEKGLGRSWRPPETALSLSPSRS